MHDEGRPDQKPAARPLASDAREHFGAQLQVVFAGIEGEAIQTIGSICCSRYGASSVNSSGRSPDQLIVVYGHAFGTSGPAAKIIGPFGSRRLK